MHIQTALTHIKDEKEYIRDRSLSSLIEEVSFSEAIWFLLRGTLPTDSEKRVFNALLVAAIDHGPGTASGQVARIVTSAKNSMHVSVASAILAMGERHGGAIEGAAQFFRSHVEHADATALAQELKEQKVRVPGFGHAVLSVDHRSVQLFEIAKKEGVYGKACAFAETFHSALSSISSKPLPINIDGSMAAILLDLGFDVALMKGIFMIARVPGLVAQSYEEQTHDVGLRRLEEKDIEFVG